MTNQFIDLHRICDVTVRDKERTCGRVSYRVKALLILQHYS